ncbi:hypothetical protein FZEAL_10463 [Fusarium zealandicum]|uniref:Phosphoketolase n=1 Tax=Fusarium zealandicum TaxID=1053134 RepID=A0A8H4U1C4_9HYPO|nr:hypothetical protein FZEAL_10463 [Fusarium zealandicum]
MPGEVIDRPNPAALDSRLPDKTLELVVNPPKVQLDTSVAQSLKDFQQAACYIAGSMIFLRDNVFIDRDLQAQDIKPRLLGHWGTCPGLILVWSHLNLLIRNHDMDMIYVIGPGHGAPAALASLWLEGSLERFFPQKYGVNKDGLRNLITGFSVPGGFPSHINSETPGSIHEGGELGYALAVSFGAVMDNPDLIVTCVIGDGEAESGPTAAAWHSIKYIDPAESGAVIPILHVNGFKISERTIFGCMDNKELVSLFSGYGYQVTVVETLDEIDVELSSALEWAVSEIKAIQKAARGGNPIVKPRYPMIVLRTPKGWTGPKKVDGEFIEGSFHAHQIPVPNASKDEEHLKILQTWLQTYDAGRLLKDGKPAKSIMDIIPQKDDKRLGQLTQTYNPYKALDLPDWKPFAVEKSGQSSSMQQTGQFLDKVIEENPKSFRIFSPDELESNKLSAVLEHTGRNFQWDQFSRAQGGRVIEILSEHCCQGWMQGYTLTGRTALFPSYESFLGIIHTMMVQYSKFNKIAREVDWRGDLSSINYIETSTWARQEHNGFSHQNPSFIGAVLNLKAEAARVYLPPDANCFLSTVHHCLKSKNYVNLMIGSKQPTGVYLSPDDAAEHCKQGASIWKFASTDEGKDPDVVIVGIGVEVTFEVVKAAEILQDLLPDLRVRVINVTDLMVLAAETRHPHSLSRREFLDMFTDDKAVCFNYHGYAAELQGLLWGRPDLHRMSVEGYKEEGSTTTPFDMMLVNCVSRFDVAKRALKGAAEYNDQVKAKLDETLKKIDDRVEEVRKYIHEEGADLTLSPFSPETHSTTTLLEMAASARALLSFLLPSTNRLISWTEFGSPLGRPVIFLHGIPASRLEGAEFHQDLHERNIRLIAPDRPRFGRSEFVLDRTIGHYAGDVQALAKHLRLAVYAVMGGSGGGPYALACARHMRPEDGLRAVSVFAGVGPPEGERKGLNWRSVMNTHLVNRMPGVLRYLLPVSLPVSPKRRFHRPMEKWTPDPSMQAESLKKLRATIDILKGRDREVMSKPGTLEYLTATMVESNIQGFDGFMHEAKLFSQP